MAFLEHPTVRLFLLVSTRLSGLFLLMPAFSSRAVPMRVRAGALLLFSFLLVPVVGGGEGTNAGQVELSPETLAQEFILGLVLGLGSALLLSAGESAGDMLAVQMGLSGANVLDPSSGTQMPVLGQLLGLFLLASLFAVGGHLVLLESLRASFAAFPPGQPSLSEGGLLQGVLMAKTQFALGLRFAAPVVAAMMMGNAVLGVMARTVPQLNVLLMAFPLQIGLGLLVLALALPLMAAFMGGWEGHYIPLVEEVLSGASRARGGP